MIDICLNMMFNQFMAKQHELHADAALIDALGGASKLADLLGYDKTHGGVQRIQNWKTRGIPASVKLTRPDIFLTELIERVRSSDDAQPPTGGTLSKFEAHV